MVAKVSKLNIGAKLSLPSQVIDFMTFFCYWNETLVFDIIIIAAKLPVFLFTFLTTSWLDTNRIYYIYMVCFNQWGPLTVTDHCHF